MDFPVPNQVLPHHTEYTFTSDTPIEIYTKENTLFMSFSAGQVTIQLPIGGPYVIKQGDSIISPIWSGELWVLAGQSNMEGAGAVDSWAERPVDGISMFAMDDTWLIAQDPLHERFFSIDPVYNPSPRKRQPYERTGGAGLGMTFAKVMFEHNQNPIGLIPCARGGTSISQWSPLLKNMGGKSYYGSMMRRIERVGGGHAIKGILWYQGCTDADSNNSSYYEDRLRNFIYTLRHDCKNYNLPFYMMQISRHVVSEEVERRDRIAWNTIQIAQSKIAQTMDNVYCIPTVDLPYYSDHIHLATRSLVRLGKRIAQFVKGTSKGIYFKDVDPWFDRGIIRVMFTGIQGNLHQKDLPDGYPISGFSLRNKKGEVAGTIFNAYTDKKYPDSVFLQYVGDIFGLDLWYGAGMNPLCRLVDEHDIPVPVFGPISMPKNAIGELEVPSVESTTFIMQYRQSKRFGEVIIGENVNFDTVYPPESETNLQNCDWPIVWASKPTWPEGQGLLWVDERDGKTGVYYLWSCIDSDESWNARLWYGFGGKARLWWNGQEIRGFKNDSRSIDRNQTVNPVVINKGKNILFIKALSFTALDLRWIGTVRVELINKISIQNIV